jgi:hypothetical protein
MVSFAAMVEICLNRHSCTCRRIGSKFRCIRSPIARLSSSEKFFECFAKTAV